MPPPADNRRHERFRGTLTVQIVGDGAQRFGTLYEISEGGAFLEVSPLPPIGAAIGIVAICDGEQAMLPALVRYRLASDLGTRGLEGVGLSWDELEEDARALVERLLARAQSGQPLRG